MKTKYFLSFIILVFSAGISVILISSTLAQTKTAAAPNIQYPVKELNNCPNEAACRAFCDKPENTKVCLDFAEKNNLMSQKEIQSAKKFMDMGEGPGGCKTKNACEEYCDNIAKITECVFFAEKNNLLPENELAEAKKIKEAIDRGVKPPPCPNKKQCDVYCSNPDHMEECVIFAEQAGFLPPNKLEESKKVLAAIKKGVKPPPCNGKEACDVYCQEESHFEECVNFAEAAGFMNPQELEMARKTKGKGPGGCRGKAECDAFCQKEENMQTCVAFAEQNGLVSKEEAEMMRKTGGKGPGDCKSKEECDAFCNTPANQETCMNFAKEHGMIPEEKMREMQGGMQKFQEALSNMPPQVSECLNSSVGAEMMEKFRSGAAMPPKEIGDKMRECFEKNMPQPSEGTMAPGAGGMMPPQGMAGPGGCKSAEECKTYCSEPAHTEECQKFMGQPQPGPAQPGPAGSQGIQPPQGSFGPIQMQGPGGCKSPEECKAYCETHLEECKNFRVPNMPAGTMPGTMPGGSQQITPPQTMPPGGMMPASGTMPGGMIPQGGMMPPSGMMPPTGIMPPPGENITPPPPGSTAPPPARNLPPPGSAISPQLLIGLIFNLLNLFSGR